MIGFAGLPKRGLDELAGARVAVLGAAEGSPYEAGKSSHAAGAPAAVRKASMLFHKQLTQFDHDLGGVLPDGVVDAGDIPTDPADAEGNRARIEAATRTVLATGAAPLLLGGDDSVPIPFFRAFEGHGPLVMVQVDAHVDWGDVIRGNSWGYGSTMRRAAEMPWITGMVQVGIRGLGSGTPDQLEAARTWGHRLFTARDVRRNGLDAVIAAIPAGSDCLLSIDCDGLDPSVLPAVEMPTPGGLDMGEVTELMQRVAERGRVCGCALVEFVPDRDREGISAKVVARIALTAAGLMAATPSSPPP